jgi:hypothetical protein
MNWYKMHRILKQNSRDYTLNSYLLNQPRPQAPTQTRGLTAQQIKAPGDEAAAEHCLLYTPFQKSTSLSLEPRLTLVKHQSENEVL